MALKTVYKDSHILLRAQMKPFKTWDLRVRPAASVIPVDERGRILVMREYKRFSKRWVTGFPGGIVEPGESAVQGARRECEEELGISPKKLVLVTKIVLDFPKTSLSIFLGFGLRKARAKHWDDEKIGSVSRVTEKQLDVMVRDGKLSDPRHVVAALVLLKKLKQGTLSLK